MDLQKLFDEGFEAVKSYVDRTFDGYESRIDALEKLIAGLNDRPEPVSVKSALIDRENRLVLTYSNGETKNLGVVVGRDGEDGKPGLDGLGFDDLDFEYDGEKTAHLKFVRGDQVKEFTLSLPIFIDRGLYSEGKSYDPGDGVTWAGSFWIAQEKTSEKPDSGNGWRLSVKRGRDGRDGVVTSADKSPVRVGVPKGGK